MRLVAESRLSLLSLGLVMGGGLCVLLGLLCLSMFLLAEDLKLQEQLLLLE